MATLAWLFLFLCGFQQQPGMCGFVFRFQLKSLGEEHKWRSKTKAEREGNHCSMSPCMSKPRNRWTTKSVAASGITSGPSNRSTWGSKVPWFFTSTRYTSWIENQSVSIISNRAVIKPDEVMAVWTYQSVFCQVRFSFEGLATCSPPSPSVNLTWRASTTDSTVAFILGCAMDPSPLVPKWPYLMIKKWWSSGSYHTLW